jgi:hypothetical protein
MQIPSVLTTRETRKTTRFSVRDAKCNAAGAMHRVAWALQNSKAIGQKCEKPWENQGFLSGEDRNRTVGWFFKSFEEFQWYLFTLDYAGSKPLTVARLCEYLDFQLSGRDYKPNRSAETARINEVLTPHAT